MLISKPLIAYIGRDEPLPETIPLRAGPLTMLYEAGMLRYIRLGDVEILRQVYAAVRDHNWGTVPAQLEAVQVQAGLDSFEISFRCVHQQEGVHFVWQGLIRGSNTGELSFSFDGEALSRFQRNRIGFCVLHPMDCAGQACSIEHVDASVTQGAFPQQIAPHQPYFNIRAIRHELMPGLEAEVRMEGDTFEMEDQRNWIDASYKTYCTPLGDPFPVWVEAGERVQQRITLRLHGELPQMSSEGPGPLAVTLMELAPGSPVVSLPLLGLACASHDEALSERALSRLHALDLNHLRLDLRPGDDYAARLKQAQADARRIGARLELALTLDQTAEASLTQIKALTEEQDLPVDCWLIFSQGAKTTRPEAIRLARSILGEQARIGAGTDAFFTELNREQPPVEDLNLLSYSSNPQVHAFDNASLVETLAALPVTVQSATGFAEGRALRISPLTLKMRWNPNATGPEPETAPGELPPRVDVRQMSLFGAGWTLGALAHLAGSNIEALTLYETSGWLGVLERESGSALPELFHSIPGGVYPVYHVLADLGEFTGAEVMPCFSSDSLRLSALALRQAGALRLILANHSAQTQTLILSGLSGSWMMRSLDINTIEQAMADPEAYRAQPGQPLPAGQISLQPFAVLTLDRLTEGATE